MLIFGCTKYFSHITHSTTNVSPPSNLNYNNYVPTPTYYVDSQIPTHHNMSIDIVAFVVRKNVFQIIYI